MIKYLPSRRSPKKAVTVVVHGLNNHPFIMIKLAGFLTEYGSDVVLVILSGHHNDYEKLESLSTKDLINDIKKAYQFAQRLVDRKIGVKLYFVGFSLGGLINLVFLSQSKEVFYHKMLLFAPANALRRRGSLIKLAFFLNDKFQIPSFGLRGYKAYNKIPLNIYKVMAGLVQKLESSKYQNTNQQTLVIIDPKDELVSLKKLKGLIEKYQLDQWEIYKLNSSYILKYHHLIIDKQTMGKRNWNHLTVKMLRFLELV